MENSYVFNKDGVDVPVLTNTKDIGPHVKLMKHIAKVAHVPLKSATVLSGDGGGLIPNKIARTR